ncbi:MAG: menaquinone biosynthesis family protein [Terriglobia bacterium]
MALSPKEEVQRVLTQVQELKLAHSPDSDDAFMFYALATRKISTGELKFTHVLEDIQSLNQNALQGVYDISAISFFAYPFLADQYMLLPCGASFGERYGPMIVSKSPIATGNLKHRRVAVPGKLTTAYLTLLLYEPEVDPIFVSFDEVLPCVARGEAEAGVVIHEGQLTYAQEGLNKVVDLGEWWHQTTGLPLPLGGNVIRRSLGASTLQSVARLLRESIRYSLEHREEALEYAMQFARGLDHSTADHFVSMYVNHWTLDYGDEGRQAVQTLLDRAYERGLIPAKLAAEFVEYPEGAVLQ